MDLLSSRPLWPIRDGLPATFPPLEGNASCDVVVVGAGIAGAMVAQRLTAEKLDVIVVDRREAAHGSTAGNTGLALYELDEPLHRLARRQGWGRARRVFLRCRDAIDALEKLARASRIECGFARKRSLYVAATQRHAEWLRREFEARRQAGLDVEWWPKRRLTAESSLPHSAAILSHDAAELDAYRLTYGLLMAARKAGARVHDRTEVKRWKCTARGVELRLAQGGYVRARELVVATGYESARFLPEPVGKLQSTYALATEPVGTFEGWPAERCLIWDTADPYLYLRTTSDGRAIIGGYDEPFRDPRTRDRLLAGKTTALKRRFRQLLPAIPLEVATSWAGTFGVTEDGLPFIGRHRALPRTWFALGFGGNGTTFSVIAAEMIRAGILGERDPDAELFGFERRERGT